MKKTGFVSFVALVVTFIAVAFSSEASAETYLGKFCWEMQDPEETDIQSFNVYAKDGGVYELYGANDESVTHGSAMVINGKIWLNLQSTGRISAENEAWAYSVSAQLDPSTMSGTGDAIGSSETLVLERLPITFKYIACP